MSSSAPPLSATDSKRLTQYAREAGELLGRLSGIDRPWQESTSVIRKLRELLPKLEALAGGASAVRVIIAAGPDGAGLGTHLPPASAHWPGWRRRLHEAASEWLGAVLRGAPKQRKRRRTPPGKVTPLTEAQLEAYDLIARHNGNKTAAAREAGKSRAMMAKLYGKALAKLAKHGVREPKTQNLPHDKRGQADVADPKAPDVNAVDPHKRRR
jgi:hypothetical protein